MISALQLGMRITLTGQIHWFGMEFYIYLQARKIGLLGCVKKAVDSQVEIIVEGSQSQIDSFLHILQQPILGTISRLETESRPHTGNFTELSLL